MFYIIFSYLFKMKNKKILILPILLIIFASCTNQQVNIINSNIIAKNTVDFNKGFKVTLKLKNISTFKTKNSSSAVLPKTDTDISSYHAFLTTNYNTPFALGTNPLGDGVITQVSNSNSVSIVFNNVPRNGTYYAVLSAFDGNTISKNITKVDPSISIVTSSEEQKWSRSKNSVTISNSGALSFIDKISGLPSISTALNIDLSLQEGVSNSIETSVNVTDGNPIAQLPVQVF